MSKAKLFYYSKYLTQVTLSFIAITLTLVLSLLAPELAYAKCDVGGSGCGGG